MLLLFCVVMCYVRICYVTLCLLSYAILCYVNIILILCYCYVVLLCIILEYVTVRYVCYVMLCYTFISNLVRSFSLTTAWDISRKLANNSLFRPSYSGCYSTSEATCQCRPRKYCNFGWQDRSNG